jgi:hypothetical protein
MSDEFARVLCLNEIKNAGMDLAMPSILTKCKHNNQLN